MERDDLFTLYIWIVCTSMYRSDLFTEHLYFPFQVLSKFKVREKLEG